MLRVRTGKSSLERHHQEQWPRIPIRTEESQRPTWGINGQAERIIQKWAKNGQGTHSDGGSSAINVGRKSFSKEIIWKIDWKPLYPKGNKLQSRDRKVNEENGFFRVWAIGWKENRQDQSNSKINRVQLKILVDYERKLTTDTKT